MIEANHPRLSVVRQCELVSIARSWHYYAGKGESALNLKLMRLIDEQFLTTPWYGLRQMARSLRRQGYGVGRKRIRRLMRQMGLALAKYGRPKIFNTDQGSQFTSQEFTEVLKRAGVRISMDGKGRWMDNIFIERLWRLSQIRVCLPARLRRRAPGSPDHRYMDQILQRGTTSLDPRR